MSTSSPRRGLSSQETFGDGDGPRDYYVPIYGRDVDPEPRFGAFARRANINLVVAMTFEDDPVKPNRTRAFISKLRRSREDGAWSSPVEADYDVCRAIEAEIGEDLRG